MANLIIHSPLPGWCLPIDETPDEVFASRMAGDGVAIDPTGGVLYAPCEGEVMPVGELRHAVTVRTVEGFDVLMHIGIDTVKLNGEGFQVLVKPGKRVKLGTPLVRFDLDFAARRAASPITPIIIASEGAVIVRRVASRTIAVGDFLMEVGRAQSNAQAGSATSARVTRARFIVPFDHGLHARPAASIMAALRPFSAIVLIEARGKTGNARSAIALMGLGVQRGDTVEVIAEGDDADETLVVLGELLQRIVPEADSGPRTVGERTTRAVNAPLEIVPLAPETTVTAVIAHQGLAAGTAFQLGEPELVVPEAAGDAESEAVALHDALAAVRTHLETLQATSVRAASGVLAAHVELIQDPELESAARVLIQEGRSAAYAWRESTRVAIAILDALDDPRMAERAADLRDLELQVLRVLSGRSPSLAQQLPEQAILIAEELLPSQLVGIERARVAGICSAFGGPTSHAALIAASMDIPMLVAAGPGVLSIANGTPLVVDAERGELGVAPGIGRFGSVTETLRSRAAQQRIDLAAAHLSCQTTDGEAITLLANLGSIDEVEGAVERGAEGCGLLRSEFLFLGRDSAPDEDEQAREYQAFALALAERPLTIRTLDIGGDKPIPYLPLPEEDNPALGLRGLRTSLWRPQLLRDQLAAMLRVEPHGQCRILLPMVTELDDVRAVRTVIDELCQERGIDLPPELGIMIETPASALLAEQLLREVDFLSIGTNDLSQYTLAMDRGHPQLAARLDALHPSVLRLIAAASEAAQSAGKPAAVCGALGSDIDAIPILMGLGIREFSALPAMIPRIKRMVRLIALSECRVLAWEALDLSSATAVRGLSRQWRENHHNAKALGA